MSKDNNHSRTHDEKSNITYGELLNRFNKADANACSRFDCDGFLSKENIEERLAFLEQEWVTLQGFIGTLLSKLADMEEN